MRASWEDAVDLLVHLHDEARSRRLMVLWDASLDLHDMRDLERLAEEDGENVEEALRALGARVMVEMLDGVGAAEPVYVSPDVCAAWQDAAATFEPEPIHEGEPFPPHGLVLFPEALPIGPKGRPVRAVLWGHPQSYDELAALMVVGFCRLADFAAFVGPHPEDVDRLREQGQRWMASWQWQLPMGQAPDQYEARMIELAERAQGTDQYPGKPQPAPVKEWRHLQSFWRFAQAFTVTPEPLSRATSRAARRARVHVSTVTVIRLRRLSHRDPEAHREVDWACRWIVRGHWRRLKDGRQTYVRPHVKGPEGLPLRVTERVWEFVR